MKKFITTTLPYISGNPHVGFALEILQSDIISRYLKNKYGEHNIFFSTGLDEYGLKIQNIAKEKNIDTQQYCDDMATIWFEFLKMFNIQVDKFYRTTSEEHKKGVIRVWNICKERGDIYKKEYEACYCVGCESFKTEKDLVDGKCPDHLNIDIKSVKEENYFFKLSKYKEHLLQWIEESKDFLTPKNKLEELKNQILEIEDISVSRLKTSVSWGIEVPDDSDHTIYIWINALANYIISAGWNVPDEDFNEKWSNSIQWCGSDNLKFQAVIWQGILASLNLPPTKKLLVHGTVLDEQGRKMSKSVGNVVDPIEQLDKYGLTAVRYYILAGLPTYYNCNWNEKEIVLLYNSHLANNFGNLVNRINHLLDKFNLSEKLIDVSEEFRTDIDLRLSKIDIFFDKFEIKSAIDELNNSNSYINQILTLEAPWQKEKKEEDIIVTLSKIYWYLSKTIPYYRVILPERIYDIEDVIINKKKTVLFNKI